MPIECANEKMDKSNSFTVDFRASAAPVPSAQGTVPQSKRMGGTLDRSEAEVKDLKNLTRYAFSGGEGPVYGIMRSAQTCAKSLQTANRTLPENRRRERQLYCP